MLYDRVTMKKDTHDKQVGLRMDSDAIAALERIGLEIDRSVSWLIRTSVDEYIERYRAAKRQAAKQSSEQSSGK
jgi:predicted transcriptional regulator